MVLLKIGLIIWSHCFLDYIYISIYKYAEPDTWNDFLQIEILIILGGGEEFW